jgi:hypothetical protein
MERLGRITFEDKMFEDVPSEPSQYVFEHSYFLEIELDQDYIYENDEFKGVHYFINVSARHSKVYKRDGKTLSDDLVDDYIEFALIDPMSDRLSVVKQELISYVNDNPWLHKLIELM